MELQISVRPLPLVGEEMLASLMKGRSADRDSISSGGVSQIASPSARTVTPA
jgi:hypothetical protein